ncbi:MAG: arsenite methyltransferase [Alteromonadaceae bacterium]|jgi:arsenite methyltransferase
MLSRCCVDFYQLPLTQLLLGDSFHPGGLNLTHQLALQTLVNRQSKVLDVAAGKGTTAHYLANTFGATTYAVDRGIANLKIAKNNFGRQKINILQGDATHLPFRSDSFDVVFCECALSTFGNRKRALTEMYRVLKPRGFIAISDVYLNEPMPTDLHERLSQWLCISGSLNATHSQQIIEYGGFRQVRFTDVSAQLLETIHAIEAKLTSPDPDLSQLIETEFHRQQTEWHEGIASRLAKFIYNGGAGYYTLTARKPA